MPTPVPRADDDLNNATVRWCPYCSRDRQLSSTCRHDEAWTIECPAPGTRIAQDYEFVSLIGAGGIGVVYKCRNVHLDKMVAVKMLAARRYGQEDIIRFQKEARATGRFNHPNLVSVHDFGIANGGDPFMVLEFLDGKTLTELTREREISLPELILIFIECCRGVAYAHEHGVLHRDLKPDNIMIVNVNGETIVKVLDFGIAKFADASQESTRGLTFGTPTYMSPEQTVSAALTDRSDVYSIGCAMYEALCRQRPFSADNVLELMRMHQSETPRLLSEARTDKQFPDRLEALVETMLLKEPSERPSVHTVIEELEQTLEEIEQREEVSDNKVAPVMRRSLRAIASVSIMSILIACGITIFALIFSQKLQIDKTPPYTSISAPFTDTLLPGEQVETEVLEGFPMKRARQQLDSSSIVVSDFEVLPEQVQLIVSQAKRCNQLRLLNCSGLKAEYMRQFSKMPVEIMSIRDADIDNEGMRALPLFKKLRHLQLVDLRAVDGEGHKALTRCPLISELYLEKELIDVDILRRMPKLQMIEFNDDSSITDRHFDWLPTSDIRILHLNKVRLTKERLEKISQMSKLFGIRMMDCNLTEGGLAIVANAPDLRSLDIRRNKGITDRSVSLLQKIYHRKIVPVEFILDDTSITSRSVPIFKSMKRLAKLELIRLRGIDQQVKSELKMALPTTVVKVTGDAE